MTNRDREIQAWLKAEEAHIRALDERERAKAQNQHERDARHLAYHHRWGIAQCSDCEAELR